MTMPLPTAISRMSDATRTNSWPAHRLVTTQVDATLTILALAAGDLSEDEFAHWLRNHIPPRKV